MHLNFALTVNTFYGCIIFKIYVTDYKNVCFMGNN